ncbi:hypothetical protein V1264_013193 [Littorina saxatilis]
MAFQAKSALSQCTQDGPCKCTSDKGTLDLTPITGNPPFSDQSDSSGSWLFSYSPCTPFTEGSMECTNVAACQVSADMSQTYPTGTVDSATFGQGSDGSTQVTYASTDSSGTTRTTIVTLTCDETADPGTLNVVGEDPNNAAHYDMTLTSKHACFSGSGPGPGPGPNPGPGGGSDGLSVGSILCIVLIATLFVYVAAGIAIQKGVRKASGKEVIPNYTVWSAVPGLIKEGVQFTFRGCKGSSSYDKV